MNNCHFQSEIADSKTAPLIRAAAEKKNRCGSDEKTARVDGRNAFDENARRHHDADC